MFNRNVPVSCHEIPIRVSQMSSKLVQYFIIQMICKNFGTLKKLVVESISVVASSTVPYQQY